MSDSAMSIFRLLGAAALRPREFLTRDSGIEVLGGDVQLAVDSQGLPVLLIPLSKEEPDISDSASRGIGIETYLLRPGEVTSRTLVVRCEDGVLVDQFARLVDHMLHALRGEPHSPGAAAMAVFERWRRLFEPSGSSLLSREAQIGLLAELHFLERLLQSDRLGQNALSAWHGPDKSRHDFVSRAASVEVKSTLAREQFLITVHGAKQLDDPAEGALFVYAEQFEEAPGGDSVSSVVERILGVVSDEYAFLDALSRCGYVVQDREAYSSFKFELVRSRVCRVDSAFPRIVSKALKDEHAMDKIQKLEYSINVSLLAAATESSQSLDFASGLMI